MTKTTGKAFQKGEIAIHIGSLNHKNTFYFRRVRVESCGARKMTLSDAETGQKLGCNFHPGIGFDAYGVNFDIACASGSPRHHIVRHGTFKDMTDAEAEAFCLELATSFLAAEIKQLKARVAEHAAQYGEDTHYHRQMSEQIAHLETLKPEAKKYGA